MSAQFNSEEIAPIVVELRDGRRVSIRPIRPDDREELKEAFERLSFEARYTRFMSAIKQLPAGALERAGHPVAGANWPSSQCRRGARPGHRG